MNRPMERLFEAVSQNHFPAVSKWLRKRYIDVNYVDENGANVLSVAVANNHIEMVRYLIENGADMNNNRQAASPLLVAIKYKLIEMASVLIDLGASVDEGWCEGRNIMSPLGLAAISLNYKMVRLLLKKGANVHFRNPQDQSTVMHYMAVYPGQQPDTAGRLKIAKLLLKNGADIRTKDINGCTPLDGVVIVNIELAKLFIQEGAEVRIRSESGMIDYLPCVLRFNDPELVRLCLERGSDFSHPVEATDGMITAYNLAMNKCSPEVVKVFWEFGCPVDLPPPGTEGKEAKLTFTKMNLDFTKVQIDFFQGIRHDDINKVSTAIEKGAVPKGISKHIFPLHYVGAYSTNYKIARILLEKGVAVNRLDSTYKQSSLYFAVKAGNVNVVKEILMFGGCFTKYVFGAWQLSRDGDTEKVLLQVIKTYVLTKRGSYKAIKEIKQLLRSGDKDMAKVLMNCVDWQGRSLLGMALSMGHVKLAEKLMKLRIKYL